jgi:GcrA cell cycle regulator
MSPIDTNPETPTNKLCSAAHFRELAELGLSREVIAAHIGITPKSASDRAFRMGLKLPCEVRARPQNVLWTFERVEILKRLWAQGLSASQIAGRLGGVTRNAVIGKVHRLGLSSRVTTSRKPKARRAPIQVSAAPPKMSREEAERQAAARRRELEEQAARAAEQQRLEQERLTHIADEELEPVAPARGVALLDLKEAMCRFPHGDPKDSSFHFCGERRADGSPYCGTHSMVAFQPMQRRRPLTTITQSLQ